MPKLRKPIGCLFILCALLLVLLILIQILAPGIGTSVANQQLPEQLGTESSLESVKLKLLRGGAGIRNLVIEQPEGFEGDPLLELSSLDAGVRLRSLSSQDPIVVRKVHLDGLNLRMITDTNQVSNVSLLGPKSAEQEEDSPADPVVEEEPASAPPALWVKKVLLENIDIVIQDLSKELTFEFSDIELELNNLRIEAGDSEYEPAHVRAELEIVGPRVPGYIVVEGRIDTIDPVDTQRVAPMQLAIGVFGFDLKSVDPLLKPSPAAARTALGGSAFDMEIFMQITPGEAIHDQQLLGTYELFLDGGGTLSGDLGGALSAPDFPPAQILGNMMGHQFARLGRMGINVAEGGLQAGKAVLDTGGAAVKGVGKSAMKLGGGLLKTAKGVATLDMGEAGAGLKDATVGTVSEVGNTVTDTAGTAVEGVGSTAGSVTGGDSKNAWWEQIEARKDDFQERSATWLNETEFPPVKTDSFVPGPKPVEAEEGTEEGASSEDEEEGEAEGIVEEEDDEEDDSLRSQLGDD